MYSPSQIDPEQTIAAIASPAGAGGRGIIRVSGANALKIVGKVLREATPPLTIGSRLAERYSCTLPFGQYRAPLAIDLFVWPGTRSYTGQPTVEIHTISSPPILESLLGQIYEQGARPAGPGEFTMRAVLTGKMTLLQAEAVLGVIDAESERDLDQALTQLAGGISSLMRTMRDDLLSDLADLEAGLDFVDEDIDFVDRDDFLRRLVRIEAELEELCEAASQRMMNRPEFRVVLAGLPNAGKSTLFNALTGKQALVSDRAGTTTDYLSATVERDGIRIQFLDTAGWELGLDEIQQQAQSHRQLQLDQADLILWCSSADDSGNELDAQRLDELRRLGRPVARIATKSDLAAGSGEALLSVSVAKSLGLEELWSLLIERASSGSVHRTELLSTSAARCRDALYRTRDHIQSAKSLAETTAGDELIAEEIRGALRELGMILGQVHTDDLLDLVFSRFCIGK